MPANNDNEGKERRIRDMLGLVKFCLETTTKEDASGNSSGGIATMDPDRRAWLQEAMSSMTVDTTQQLLENLALVKQIIAQLEEDPNHNIAVQKTCNALEVLTNLCEQIDYACDFAKLDGFSIFKPLIGCAHEELIVRACELIAALSENNPICQKIALNTRLLERLIDFVSMKDQTHIKARSYALYAISAIIRSNKEVCIHFMLNLDGLTVLLQLLDYQQNEQILDTKTSPATSTSEDSKSISIYWSRKLLIRTVYLMATLCSESPIAAELFFKKQGIIQLTKLLENPYDPEIREHLLQALKSFLDSQETPQQIEALQSCPNLKDILEGIQISTMKEYQNQLFSGDYDLTETESISREIVRRIYSFEKEDDEKDCKVNDQV